MKTLRIGCLGMHGIPTPMGEVAIVETILSAAGGEGDRTLTEEGERRKVTGCWANVT